jgi:hypothetical protein
MVRVLCTYIHKAYFHGVDSNTRNSKSNIFTRNSSGNPTNSEAGRRHTNPWHNRDILKTWSEVSILTRIAWLEIESQGLPRAESKI